MNWEQVKGIVERVATMGFMYAAGKGWIPEDMVGTLITVVVSLGSVGWAMWVNTPKQLAVAAEKVDK